MAISRNFDALVNLFKYIDVDQFTGDSRVYAESLKEAVMTKHWSAEKITSVLLQLYKLKQSGENIVLRDGVEHEAGTGMDAETLLPSAASAAVQLPKAGTATTKKNKSIVQLVTSLFEEVNNSKLEVAIGFEGTFEVKITDEFLDFLKVQLLNLAPTDDSVVKLIKKITDTSKAQKDEDYIDQLAALEQIFSPAPLNIAEFQKIISTMEGTDLQGNETIVLLGDTGAGKSTATYFMFGSTFNDYFKIEKKKHFGFISTDAEIPLTFDVNKWPEILNGKVVISSKSTSETQIVSSFDLNDSMVKEKFVDHGFKNPVLVCDTPGFADTSGGKQALINATAITKSLRTAGEVRPVVVLPARYFMNGVKATAFLQVLENVQRLFVDINEAKKSIFYCLSGDVEVQKLIPDVIKMINDALGNQKGLKYSDGVKVLLEDIKEKIQKKPVPLINPRSKAKDKLTPQGLVKAIRSLPPINNPKAFMTFMEKGSKEALTQELSKLNIKLASQVGSLIKEVQDGKKEKYTVEMRAIDAIVGEFAFIHNEFGAYDEDGVYGASQETINQLVEFLTGQIQEIFNPAAIKNKKISDADLDRFAIVSKLLSKLRTMWAKHYNKFMPDQLEEKYFAAILKKYHVSLQVEIQSSLDHLAPIAKKFEENAILIQRGSANVKEVKEQIKLGDLKEIGTCAYNLSRFEAIKGMGIIQSKLVDKLLGSLGQLRKIYDNALKANEFIAAATAYGITNEIYADTDVKYDADGKIKALFFSKLKSSSIIPSFLETGENQPTYYPTAEQVTDYATNNDLDPVNDRDLILQKLCLQFNHQLRKVISSTKMLRSLFDNKFATPFMVDEPISLRKIYEQASKWVAVEIKKINQDVLDIARNQESIDGIAKLVLPVQVYELLTDVVSSHQIEHKGMYIEAQSKIKVFVSGFSQRYCEKLNTKTNVLLDAEEYSSMDTYLKQLKTHSYIKLFNLENENKEKIMTALVTRVKAHLKHPADKEESTDEKLIRFAGDVSKYKQVVADIYLMQEKLATHLSDKDDSVLRFIIDGFKEMVKVNLADIIAACGETQKFNNSTAERIIGFANYISDCEAVEFSTSGNPFADEVLTAKAVLTKAIEQRHQLYSTKFFENIATLDRITADRIVRATHTTEPFKLIVAVLDRLRLVREKLPEYYGKHEDVYDVCQKRLVKFVGSLDELLAKTISAMAGEDQTAEMDTKVNALLSICKHAESLDVHLPATAKTFKAVHQEAKNRFAAVSGPFVAEVMGLVRNGAYQQVIEKVASLTDESGDIIKSILRIRISGAVDTLAKQIKTVLVRLTEFDQGYSDKFPRLVKDMKSLQEAENLDADLLNKEVRAELETVLTKISPAINAWFAKCVTLLNAHIVQFRIHDFYLLKAALKKGLETMHIKPDGYEDALVKIDESFKAKLRQVADGFTQSIDKWNGSFSLAHIYLQLTWSGSPHDGDWDNIARDVFKAIDTKCSILEAEFAAKSRSVAEVVDALCAIEKLIVGVPANSFLVANVAKRCQATFRNLVASVVTTDNTLPFADQFRKISEFMANKERLEVSARDVDLSSLLSPLHDYFTEALDKITGLLTKGRFPQQDLRDFISYYDQAIHFTAEFGAYFNRCQGVVLDFINKSLSELRKRFDNRDKNELERIQEICGQVAAIAQERHLLKTFSLMVPATFDSIVCSHFAAFYASFVDNKEAFDKAIREHNINGLKHALDVVSSWKDAVSAMVQYINSDTEIVKRPKMADILKYNNECNLASLGQLIRREIDTMVVNVTTDVSAFNSNPNKGKDARTKFYIELKIMADFLGECDLIKEHCDVKDQCDQLLASTQSYLKQLYEDAVRELSSDLIGKKDWNNFDNYYKELALFAECCAGNDLLRAIKLDIAGSASDAATLDDGKKLALDAARDLEARFKQYIAREINTCKAVIEAAGSASDEDKLAMRGKIIEFILGLQRIVRDVTGLSEYMRKQLGDFLVYIHITLKVQYLELISTELQKEKTGLGAMIISEQSCFAGIAIAARNTLTLGQDINYVLDNLHERTGTDEPKKISDDERVALHTAYQDYETIYDGLVTEYLKPELDFAKNPAEHLKKLLADLNNVISADPIDRDANNHIVWNEKLCKKIVPLMAHIFAIWTLRDSKAYFDAGKNADKVYLKKPHPGQIVAIIRMLNAATNGKEIQSHLSQVLTGEGKSVVMAVVSAILAKIGFSVSCACYSEYLSSRDLQDFDAMFKLLEVDQYVEYGTFKNLSENILNAEGDLRQLTEQVIDGKPLESKKKEERQSIVVVDEVDVFFSKFLYGSFYNPVLSYQAEKIAKDLKDIIDTIWQKQFVNNETLTLTDIKSWDSYKACYEKLGDYAYLLDKAILEMLEDYGIYADKSQHPYVVVQTKDGKKIGYQDQDAVTTDISERYKTMWAYYLEYSRGAVAKEAWEASKTLLINCGNYSYGKMLKPNAPVHPAVDPGLTAVLPHVANDDLFRCILGVTGTLRELGVPAQNIIHSEYGIGKQTFVPSVYGINKLKFAEEADTKVVKDAEYHIELAKKIAEKRMGALPGGELEPMLPVITFFENEEELMAFKAHCEAQKYDFVSDLHFMTNTSSSTVEEENKEINTATQLGKVTLAVKEKGRGRDFRVYSPHVNLAGGVQIVGAYPCEQLSEEVQLGGRTARQGQKGSYCRVWREGDIKKIFGVTDEQIADARTKNSLANLITDAREKHFATTYRELIDTTKAAQEILHNPSAEWLDTLRHEGEDKAKLLQAFKTMNRPVAEKKKGYKKSRTEIAIDATGSMDRTIRGVRQILTQLMQLLNVVLKASEIADDSMELQLCIYRHYSDGVREIFSHSEWSSKPEQLQAFIDTISASGGTSRLGGREAMEVAALHALNENATQTLIIGDVGPEKLEWIKQDIASDSAHQTSFYKDGEDMGALAKRAKEKLTPFHMFYVSDRYDTKKDFDDIAEASGGKSTYLDANSSNGATQLMSFFGERILEDVADGDATKFAQMQQLFASKMHK